MRIEEKFSLISCLMLLSGSDTMDIYYNKEFSWNHSLHEYMK